MDSTKSDDVEFAQAELDRRRFLSLGYLAHGIPMSSGHVEWLSQKAAATNSLLQKPIPTANAGQGSLPWSESSAHEGRPSYGGSRRLWATVLRPDPRSPFSVPVEDDTGTPNNWIHPRIVHAENLECRPYHGGGYQTLTGEEFRPEGQVHLSWMGRDTNKTFHGVFLVTPHTSTIDMLLGKGFVDKEGRAHEICAKEPVRKPGYLAIPSRIKKKEADEIRENEARNEREAEELAAAVAARRLKAQPRDKGPSPSPRSGVTKASHSRRGSNISCDTGNRKAG